MRNATVTECATVDWTSSPPSIELPRTYNASAEFIDRNVRDGLGDKIALIDESGSYTYAGLAGRVNRAGNVLHELGAGMETKVLLCLTDSVDFPAVFWGAIKIGAVAIPVNTLLITADYDYMLRDSRASILIVSDVLYEKFEPILGNQPHLSTVLVSGATLMASATSPS